MKFCTIFIVLLSFGCLDAMEEIASIVAGTVVMTSAPGRRLTWTAQLNDGQIVNASSCYKRRPRNACVEDPFMVRYVGRIGKKRMDANHAELWLKKLIKASIGARKG
jgi:hypothetical protein